MLNIAAIFLVHRQSVSIRGLGTRTGNMGGFLGLLKKLDLDTVQRDSVKIWRVDLSL